MGERLLSLTQIAENIFCIYRNYLTRGKLWKLWMTFRIATEIFFIVVYDFVQCKFYRHPTSDVIYFFITSWHSLLIIIFAVCHSKKYASFIAHLNFGYRVFVKDNRYRQNLEAKHTALIILVITIALCKFAFFLYDFLFPVLVTDLHAFWHFCVQFYSLICDLRYVFEFVVLYCFLYVMHEQIASIARSLNGEQVLLSNDFIIQMMGGHCNQKIMSEVQKWCVGYKHVRESCKYFNSIFGFQLTWMLTAAIVFYIILMYTTTSESLKGALPPVGIVMYSANLLLMLYILFMLSYSAQQMQNSADNLRRRLCKALIFSLSDRDTNYQSTKALLRIMSTSPIHARAFGAVPVDMSLFPACISVFTSYTVIALQFTNVIP